VQVPAGRESVGASSVALGHGTVKRAA